MSVLPMPSDQSTWIISAPLNGDSEGIVQELTTKLTQHSKSISANSIAELGIPSFKVRVLDIMEELLNNGRIDRDFRLAHSVIRRPAKAGYILHEYRRKGRRYSAQFAQQRSIQIIPAYSSE